MSLKIGIRKEGIGLIFPFFLLTHRKRKRHTKKHREGQSMRLSTRQRGC
jgi:hypothetical protein